MKKDNRVYKEIDKTSETFNIDLLKAAVNSGGDVNYIDNDNFSSLSILPFAVYNNKLKIAKYLVAHGADVNIGISPLITSFIEKDWELAKYFIEIGVDINKKYNRYDIEDIIKIPLLLYHILEYQPEKYSELKNIIKKYYSLEELEERFPLITDMDDLGLL